MITGFNTDIEHEGVVYHVQTEDKGLDSPLILSLVYAGGAILASKRSRYEDLIEAGFNEEVLTQRLQRQHRLICAAINAGRLEELKRMGAKPRVEAADPDDEATATGMERVATLTTEEEALAGSPLLDASSATKESVPSADVTLEESRSPQTDLPSQPPISAYTVHDPRRQAPQKVIQAESGVTLTILGEDEFRAGETFTVRILLADNSRSKPRPLPGVPVSVKVLGTAFRPQIYSVKTERDGVVMVSIKMPKFTSGRAAVLVRTELKGETIEARRVILPAR
ncbi:MAG TPA: hypothetical protein VMZ30_03885 [Pyrinomonadaceae bacterium]|nr:hypothetical protein [Pyrinomonadaceae bacterium]